MAIMIDMQVEVVYASPERQALISLDIAKDATVQQAILQSGILNQFPEIDLKTAKIGIFSQKTVLDDTLHEHDRIEIYRPLIIDPKIARLARVKTAR